MLERKFEGIKEKLTGFFSIHNHSDYSNIRLIDALNKPKDLIKHGNDIGLKGAVLSDHETLAGHIKFIQAYKELKNSLVDDFKIGLGNEIYLVKEDTVEDLQENWKNRIENPETKFYHFLLVAKDREGWSQLQKLSSLAWEHSFKTGKMYRCPTFKSDLAEIIQGGHVMASSACLGSQISQYILRWSEAAMVPNNEKRIAYYQNELHEFITFCINIFGKENFFLEIQPSHNSEQVTVNKTMFWLGEQYGLDVIATTDSHYLTAEEQEVHRIYLQSKEGDREVDEFYATTYEMNEEMMYEFFKPYLTDEQIITAINNTMKIHEMVEVYDVFQKTVIPHAHIKEFESQHLFSEYYHVYTSIEEFANANNIFDRAYLNEIEKGFVEHIGFDVDKDYLQAVLARIDLELSEVSKISSILEDRMSQYFLLMQEIVDTIWESGSLTPAGRGSSSGYITNYLLNITQVNPLDYDLPYYRFLNSERVGLPD